MAKGIVKPPSVNLFYSYLWGVFKLGYLEVVCRLWVEVGRTSSQSRVNFQRSVSFLGSSFLPGERKFRKVKENVFCFVICLYIVILGYEIHYTLMA